MSNEKTWKVTHPLTRTPGKYQTNTETNYFNKYCKWYYTKYCHWYSNTFNANILCRPARHEVRLPPCGQEAEACFKDNQGPKIQEACYKDNQRPKIQEACYKDHVRPKSHESDASILDQAKLSTANRHRPKGEHGHLRVVFIGSTSIIIIVVIRWRKWRPNQNRWLLQTEDNPLLSGQVWIKWVLMMSMI